MVFPFIDEPMRALSREGVRADAAVTTKVQLQLMEWLSTVLLQVRVYAVVADAC